MDHRKCAIPVWVLTHLGTFSYFVKVHTADSSALYLHNKELRASTKSRPRPGPSSAWGHCTHIRDHGSPRYPDLAPCYHMVECFPNTPLRMSWIQFC